MSLQPIIREQFNGIIWRMEIDEITETVFIEVRDNQEKKVYFAVISLIKGLVLFKDLSAPERWLTGIEAAFNGILLLHFYQTETGPAHKGLMGIDANTGKILWSNYALSFDYLSVNGPVVYDVRIQPRKLYLADIKTGATTRVYEPSVYKELKNLVVQPAHIPASEMPFKLPVRPYGDFVHYYERDKFRIVSLHALKRGALNQWLYVYYGANPHGCRIIYEDLLNAGIQKMQPEAFIIHKHRLIYIKEKTELTVLPL